MDNPIRFSDLFSTDLNSGLQGLIDKVGEVETALMNMLKQVKAEAKLAGDALAGTTSSTKGGRDATSQYAAEIERLHAENEKLVKSLDSVQKQLKNMKDAKNKDKNETINLSQSYESLADLIKETGVNVEELLKSDRQLSIAKKNGETANGSLAGSYNKLYAQYNLVKNVLNAMGDEMRNNEAVGKKWEAQALSLMNTMKGMQEATGKHTLSVGDYTKAFNGLNIATQQVLREMPTLANSWSQFFIAISNNVPIFVDNLKRVQQETGSWQMAMKGVLTSVFSWQTALLVVLTILPKIAKAIHDKKKAQEEEAKAQEKATKETKKAEKAYRSLANIYTDISKSASSSVTEVNVLTKILDDNNTSLEERIGAGQRLKQIFDEELEGYSAEEIAMGKAIGLIKNLTTLIYQQAKARAALNEITELTNKQLELEERAKLYENFKYGTRTVKELSDALDEANKRGERLHLGAAEQEAVNTYRSIIGEITALQNQIKTLTEGIDPNFLIDDEKQGKATKETLDKLKDYYYDFQESIINITMEGEEKEVALSNLAYEKKIEGYKNALAEIVGTGKEEVKQREYLNGLIANLEKEKGIKEGIIRDKYEEKRLKAEEKARQERYKASVKEADNTLKIATNQADTEHRNIVRANKAKGEAEVAYWEERIRLAKEYGGDYLKDIELFESNLAKARKKAETGIESASGKTSKRRTGGLLYSILYGEAEKEDKPINELANFISNLESMKNKIIGFIDELIDKRIEMAEIALEVAEKEAEAAKTALDYEMEARANGYANNVELTRKEYEERLAIEQEAIAEKERLQKQQEAINSAMQLSDLITATAGILKGYSGIPLAGQILALAAIATMWSTFAAAKVTAAQMTATKYGEGMSEYLDYGGSHASGHDIDFGADKNGRRRRVERGEMIGVINKRNVEKYGVSRITDIIQSLNKGTFEKKYTKEDEIRREVLMRNLANERNITNESNVDDWLEKRMEMSEIAVEKASMVDKAMKDGIASYDENSTDMARLLRGLLGRKAVQTPTSSQTILKESIIKYVQPPLADIIFPSMNTDLYRNAFSGLKDGGINLEGVENKLQTLIEQGEVRVVTTPYGRIEYKGNNKRIIHNS
jgi:hypothetical protein